MVKEKYFHNIGACQCALLRALHIADCKRPLDKL